MKKNGMTIIEVLMAIILIGVAIASLVAANGLLTKANGFGLDLSTAEFLTEQIRELTTLLPVVDPQTGTAAFGPEAGETLTTYDDLDDFNGAFDFPSYRNGFTIRVVFDNLGDICELVEAQPCGDAGTYLSSISVDSLLAAENKVYRASGAYFQDCL